MKIIQDFQSALIKNIIHCNKETNVCVLTTDSQGHCLLCGRRVEQLQNQQEILAQYFIKSVSIQEQVPLVIEKASKLLATLRYAKLREELDKEIEVLQKIEKHIAQNRGQLQQIERRNEILKEIHEKYRNEVVYLLQSIKREQQVIRQLEAEPTIDQKELQRVEAAIEKKKEIIAIREHSLKFVQKEVQEAKTETNGILAQFQDLNSKLQFVEQHPFNEIQVELKRQKKQAKKIRNLIQSEKEKINGMSLEIENSNKELALKLKIQEEKSIKLEKIQKIIEKIDRIKESTYFNSTLSNLRKQLEKAQFKLEKLKGEISSSQKIQRELQIKQQQKTQAGEETKLGAQYEKISEKALNLANQIKKHPEGGKKELSILKGNEGELSKVVTSKKQQIVQIKGNVSIKAEELYELRSFLLTSNREICACQDVVKLWIQLKLKRALQQDLKLKEKTLKKSVIQYHDQKLGEVNRSIKELWASLPQSIKSKDRDMIKTVQVVHDADLEEYEGTGTNFNYRVEALYSDGYSVNMRTCSSTGEKQIASLVIRMALAQNLAPSCPLFALDQPFATLDRSYTEMLIQAIDRFIETRIQSHGIEMQVLLVTHDPQLVWTCEKKMKGISLWVRQDQQLEGCSVIIESFLKYCEAEEKMEKGAPRKKMDRKRVMNSAEDRGKSKKRKQQEEDEEEDIFAKLIEELQQK